MSRRVLGPAIGLIVTASATILMGLLFLPSLLFPELSGLEPPQDATELALTVLSMLATLGLGITTLYGSLQMLKLENYPLSMTAAITAMVPCYCCFLGLPFGIWALVVLCDPHVKQAFK